MRKLFIYALLLFSLALNYCDMLVQDPFTEEQRDKADAIYDEFALSIFLEQILEWHKTNQTEIPGVLNIGIDRLSIQDAFTDLGCQPTEELIQLWTWHNGTQYTSVPFIWYHDFLSIQDAISEYKQLTSNPLIGWRKNWIPIFSFQGEWYFLECYEVIRDASPVGYIFIESQEPIYAYLSLSKMIETSATLFSQGAVFWDSQSFGFGDDIKKVFSIHQVLNDGTQFPYHVE